MKTALFSFILLIPIVLGLWVLIGVYVYRDAKRRGMNPALWTLIAILAPAFIGFIIYLLVRNSYSDLECPRCAAPVTEDYVVCPQCGARLRPSCPGCSAPVEEGWKVCPLCAAPLEEVLDGVTPPRQRQDKGLGKILVAVILVPVLLIVFAVLGLVLFSASGGAGTISMQELTFEEYDQYQTSETVKNAVHSWLDGLEVREDRAYALRYDRCNELDDVNEYYFLIYVPAGGSQSHVSFGLNSGLFGSNLDIALERTGDSGSLLCLEVRGGERSPKPKITLDGKHISCQVSERNYNPTTFFILPDYSQPEAEGTQALPISFSVSRLTNGYADFQDGRQVSVEDPDLLRKLMEAIDSGERLPLSHPIYEGMDTFQDGFFIFICYPIHGEPQANHVTALVASKQDGVCYLKDDRIHASDHIRQLDGDFYGLLESLF